MTNRISVIGLGKLGASMAAAFASRGFNVIGVDVNQTSVDRINAGHAPVQETGLDALIAANSGRITATTSHVDAVIGSDISFVIVPTPSDDRGAFSLQYAKWAFQEIGRGLAKKTTYHNVVLTSTVLPGATREGLIPILEKASGKRAGKDFGVCYSPEFIALGSILHDFLNPDFTLIGELDDRAGSMLEELYTRVVENGAPSARMSLENAELTKISINSFITTKVTFANTIAELCEKIPGGNVDVVTDAIGRDKRIGRRYLTGAIGYGGPCFPRDNVALAFVARQLGVDAHLAVTTDSMNRAVAERIANQITSRLPDGATVAILGLAYKPFSHVTEESQGVMIAAALSKRGMRVIAFDPLSSAMELAEIRRHTVVLDSVEACLAQAQSVVITTPDPAFASLKADEFRNSWAKVVVFDLWRLLSNELQSIDHVDYVGTGLGADDERSSALLRRLWHGEPEDAQNTAA